MHSVSVECIKMFSSSATSFLQFSHLKLWLVQSPSNFGEHWLGEETKLKTEHWLTD